MAKLVEINISHKQQHYHEMQYLFVCNMILLEININSIYTFHTIRALKIINHSDTMNLSPTKRYDRTTDHY